MIAKEPYSYVVLRYAHDVLTGEFVNVGLLMAIPGQERVLERVRKAFGRPKGIFPDLDGPTFKDTMNAAERAMKAVARDAATAGLLKSDRNALDYARSALSQDDSALQWSPLGAGLTSDPERTFEQLYTRFVTRYEKHQAHHRTDDDVWRVVSAKLKERDVNVELEPKRIQGKTDAVEFRHAWKNGRWHAYEPLSFDLADADNIKDKARRWLGHLSAVKEGAAEDVQVHFIVGRPQNSILEPAFKNAVEILRQVPFENHVIEEGQIDDVIGQIEDEVRQHAGHRS